METVFLNSDVLLISSWIYIYIDIYIYIFVHINYVILIEINNQIDIKYIKVYIYNIYILYINR